MKNSNSTSENRPAILDPGQQSLLERAEAIDRKHEKFVRATGTALQRLMDLGDELNVTKVQVEEELGQGKWLTWLSEDTDVPERTAQLAMELSSRKGELEQKLKESSATVADLSIREAKRILGPRPKRGHKKKMAPEDECTTPRTGDDGDTATEENDGSDNEADNEDGVETKEVANDVSNVGDDGTSDDNLDDDEDDLNAKQFGTLCRAYENADEIARKKFHEHLKEIYGLEVRTTQDEQQSGRADVGRQPQPSA